MEPVLLLLLSLLLLSSQAASQSQDAVLDSDGNALQSGVQYYVLPANFAQGGGLRMSRVNRSCPPHVIQWSLPVQKGQPLMFFPEDLRADPVVRVAERIYFLVPRPTRCPQSTLWKVNDKGYVTTGGTVSSADPHDSRFSIFKSSGRGYVIKSCPCIRCRMACSYVVVKTVNGRRLLSVGSSKAAYEVVFVRVKEVKEESTNDILPATMLPQEE